MTTLAGKPVLSLGGGAADEVAGLAAAAAALAEYGEGGGDGVVWLR